MKFKYLLALLALVAGPLAAQTPTVFPNLKVTQGLEIPNAAPGTFTDGKIWVTTSGLFARTNGATNGPAAMLNVENVFSVPQFISLGTPQLWLNENDVAANNRAWAFGASAGGACLFAASDDAMTVTNGLCFTRSGPTITGATLTGTTQITLTSPIVTGPLYFGSVADNAAGLNLTSTNGRITFYPYLSSRGWIQWTDETAAALNPATLQAADFAFSANATGTLADFVFNGIGLNQMPLLSANNNFTGTTNTFNDIVVDSCTGCGGGGGGSPGGPDMSVQFNNAGSFDGSADLLWDGATLTGSFQIDTGGGGITVGTIDASGQVSANDSSTNYKSGVSIENNDPRLLLYEDDGSANAHAWDIGSASNIFNLWACNDSNPTTCNSVFAVARSGATPTVTTWTTELITPASTTTRAGLNLPHGTAPSSPTNGDLWTTTAGLLARINGATVGPFIDGSALNASNLSSGTVPDARFPATLPVANGSNLTNLNASNLATGTVPDARLSTNVPVMYTGYKSGTTTRASTTTVSCDPAATVTLPDNSSGVSQFYEIWGTVVWDQNGVTSNGISMVPAVSASVGTAGMNNWITTGTTNTSTSAAAPVSCNAGCTTHKQTIGSAGLTEVIDYRGTAIVLNGASTITACVSWAQNTSDGTGTRVNNGTFISARRTQ